MRGLRQQHVAGRGFTLVEMAVVIVVLLLVFGATFRLLGALKRETRMTTRSVAAQEAATNGVEAIVGLLQTAGLRGLDPANNLTGFQGTSLLFRAPQRNATGDFTLQAGQVVLNANRTQILAIGTSLVSRQVDGVGNEIVGTRRVLCENLAPDETIAGVDQDGNGVLERGVLFTVVTNEDANGNGLLDLGEDVNGNDRLDCTVAITVQTIVRDLVGAEHGRAVMTTQVALRNI